MLHPGRPNVPKVGTVSGRLDQILPKLILDCHSDSYTVQAELQEKLTKMYDVRDQNQVQVFGFRTQVYLCGAYTIDENKI